MIAWTSIGFRTALRTAAAFALLAATAARAGETVPVRVTAHNVNLRAAPNPTGDLLGQADYDDRLAARELGEEWVEIVPPTGVEAWVKAEYVQRPRNTIGANRVNVRAGASINYNVIDTLPLGAPVEPVGELGEWLKIKAPPTARVWISRQFVDVVRPEEEAPAAPEPPAPPEHPRKRTGRTRPAARPDATDAAPTPAPAAVAAAMTPIVSPSVPETADAAIPGEIPVPPPKDLKLVPLNGQGRLTEVEGKLKAAPLINEAPTHYRVVRWQNNRWQILCHVYGDAGKFRALRDKQVRVRGREYWIQKAAAPVLVPDRIQEIPDESTIH
jgi:SH3-like domain-containing protein